MQVEIRPAKHVSLSEVHGLFRKVVETTGFCCLVTAVLGTEPGTSRALSENHTTRPNTHRKSGSRRVFDDSV
jgi:hypothetical protein